MLTYDGLRLRSAPTSEDELRAIVRRGGRHGEIYRRLDRLRRKYEPLVATQLCDYPLLIVMGPSQLICFLVAKFSTLVQLSPLEQWQHIGDGPRRRAAEIPGDGSGGEPKRMPRPVRQD